MSEKLNIRDLAIAWIEKSKRRDARMLSRLSNVAYSTVRRMLQNECETSLENVAAIAEIVATPEQPVVLLSQMSPTLGKLYGPILNKSTSPDGDVRELFSDKDEFLAYCFSTKETGTSRKELSNYMGNLKMESVLESLMDSGAIFIDKDRIKADASLTVSFNGRMSYKAIDHFRTLDKLRDRSMPNTVFSAYEGFNVETVHELAKDIRSLESKIADYCQEASRKGKVNWTFGMFSNSIANKEDNDA